MNILIVSDVLGEENNGTTTAAMNLIRYLRSKGENVRILCADQEKKGQEGVFVVPHLYLGLIINWALKKNNVSLLKNHKKEILWTITQLKLKLSTQQGKRWLPVTE